MSEPRGVGKPHHYQAFGLRISSALEIPEFIESDEHLEPDVGIEQGRVEPPAKTEPETAGLDRSFVLVIPDVARYRVANGSLITIDAVPAAPERNIRLYLLGSAFGALLHQRGLLPLHANAVEIDGRAVAFMAASGEGKSTLAAWFHDEGYRVLADDVCVVKRAGGGGWLVAPGSQRLRLWKEALEASGRDPSQYRRSFEGKDDFEKFDVPFEEERRRVGECELAAIYVLETGNGFSIDRMEGVAAADAVFSHTYRGGFVNAAGLQQAHWEAAVELIKRVPIFRITRPRDLRLLNKVGALVRDHLADAARP